MKCLQKVNNDQKVFLKKIIIAKVALIETAKLVFRNEFQILKNMPLNFEFDEKFMIGAFLIKLT